MKTFISTIIFLLAAILPVRTYAQTLVVEAEGAALTQDTVAKLTSFSGKYNSAKVYLVWTVSNQHTDGLYLVYRSSDGVNFENIGFKQGVGVPISSDIAYYFTDSAPLFGTVSYKIVHMGNNSSYWSSEKIMVNSGKPELVSK